MAWQIAQFCEDDIEPIVEFWNRSFSSRRMFRPLASDYFRMRIMGRAAFNPRAFFIARSDGGIVGLGQVTGTVEKAFLSLLYVAPEFRRGGIGTALLGMVEPHLKKAEEVRTAAVVMDPVYGASFDEAGSSGLRTRAQWDGPRFSLWGSVEGIGVPVSDLSTGNFLLKRGFSFADIDFSMRIEGIQPGRFEKKTQITAGGRRYNINLYDNVYAWRSTPYHYEIPHRDLQLVSGRQVLGDLMWYKWDDSTAVLFEFQVLRQARGLGLGRAMLSCALADMAEAGCTACELNTGSRRNARAVHVYRNAGFRVAEAWQTYIETPPAT